MNFSDKQKKIICGVIAVALILPIAFAAISFFIGV